MLQKLSAGILLVKLFCQANGLAYWNPGSELNVSPVDCQAKPEVKRTSHPKRAMAPLQGASATIEDALGQPCLTYEVRPNRNLITI